MSEGLAPAVSVARVLAHRLDLRRRQREERGRDDPEREGTPREGGELASAIALVGPAGEGENRRQKRGDEEGEEREGGARVRADEAEGADQQENTLGDAAHERAYPVSGPQIRGEASADDNRGRGEPGNQRGAGRVGPLVVHGERVGRHVEQHAADDRRGEESAARGGEHRDERCQADHPHGHECQRGDVGGLDNRVVARKKRDESVPARGVVDAPAAVELVEATEGARILSVQDRVHAVLVERRVPLLDGVGRVRARKKRPRGHEEADEDRSPRGGADRSLRAADGNAYADGLAQGNSPQ